jgi:hypothetical protein
MLAAAWQLSAFPGAKMVVAGLLLKANEARIVTLAGSQTEHRLLAEKQNKLQLPKNPSQEDVAHFVQQLLAHCQTHQVERLVINRRTTSGQGAGGAGTFVLEGVLLATSPVPLLFVHPQTLKASDRRHAQLKALKPSTVDLGKAYDLAFEGLE